MSLLKLAITLACCSIATGHSAKILCLMEMCPRSHYNVFIPLIEALASRGHQVTVVSPFITLNLPNVNEIEIKNIKKVISTTQQNMFDDVIGKDTTFISLIQEYVISFCNAFVTDESFKHLLKKTEYYDLVIVDGVVNECALMIAPLIARHVMTLTPTAQPPWASSSSPVPPSAVPMVVLPYTSNMTFLQRFWNTWIQLKSRLYFQYINIPSVETLVRTYEPKALSVREATRHVSINLANADPVLFSPRPQSPDLVLVGAMHCKPAKPLPQEFTRFMEKAKGNGAIVFTLGSFVPAKDMPVKLRKAFLGAFARLKQAVFWKFEEPISVLPPNVMIAPWLPQQDLLGHNQTRLFITHGGLLSSQEAVYHGIPMITIPLYYDQIGNAARIQELGIGESLDLKDMTEDVIYETIQKILTDASYYDRMRSYSSILHDQPQTPTDRAVYWVEYVIRHEGAHHLRSSAHELSFIQYFLLDVIAFMTVVIATAVLILYCVIRCFISFWKKDSRDSHQKKKN